MKKKVLAAILSAAMVIGVTACGGTTPAPAQDEAKTEETAEAPAEEASAATEEPAAETPAE